MKNKADRNVHNSAYFYNECHLAPIIALGSY